MATAIDWPTTLPQYPQRLSASGRQRDNVIRTKNAVGPAKTRRRSTLELEDQKATYVLNYSQLVILKSFFNDDLAGGSLSFNMPFAPSYDPAEVRFKEPYVWKKIAENYYSVSMSIEEV